MYFDEFKHQLPDIDPQETDEWLASLDDVVGEEGENRARFLMFKLLKRARQLHVGLPPLTQTRYINTISPEQEPFFPGDEQLELRIRRIIRWNAVAMVLRSNNQFPGIGGHLSTYASSASLYEVGFNHFFLGKDAEGGGDQVYYQGHAAPGMYARAFLEGRLSEEQLDHFRREVSGKGLSSYPRPRLMPEFWEFPTVSMGLGPLAAIYQARFNRYLQNRGLSDTSGSRVWAFLGDGEMDEPESIAALSLASREGLDNLTFVVNCNLQRLDGPVRGNGKIIQELEAAFRGAGWHVIKVIWGREWDDLLARDVDGVLVQKMNETLDGEFQKFSVAGGAYIREHFFGPDPRLRKMVERLSDDDLVKLRRGGHDYRKVYAAYKAATEYTGAPTVILAKTIKGWTLGPGVEGRNITHQAKKLSEAELRIFRDRIELPIPDDKLKDAPYYHPGPDSEEVDYLRERRRALGGPLPRRVVRAKPLTAPAAEIDKEFEAGSEIPVSTTMAFTRLLRNLMRDKTLGSQIVPIIPDEARTFGMDPLFKEVGIYASLGQRYEPVDSELILSYREAKDGQVLEEGITEAGSMASLQAAGTSYATHGLTAIPFYIFYSITLYNENYAMPRKPEGIDESIVRGLYRFQEAPDGGPKALRVRLVGSGSILQQVLAAQGLLAEKFGVAADVYSAPSFQQLRREALGVDRWNRLHPDQTPRQPYVAQVLGPDGGPIVAATDWMRAVPDMVSRWLPDSYLSLGTDGFGRSDTREALRSFFEIDPPSIAAAALVALSRCDGLSERKAAKAIRELGINPDAIDPLCV